MMGVSRWFAIAGLLLFLYPPRSLAQDDTYDKDGAVLYSLGAGYQWMSDAYSSKGLAIDVRARFYTSGRLFYELMGHWGIHSGDKEVMQRGKPFSIHDERNCLLAAVGPGYEFWQSGNQLLDLHVKALVGYGIRNSRYDAYRPVSANDGNVTLGCEKNKKGIAAVMGLGMDTRFRRWVFTPSVEAMYVAGKWDVAPMVSIGFFY